jgi:hypothetical protein
MSLPSINPLSPSSPSSQPSSQPSSPQSSLPATSTPISPTSYVKSRSKRIPVDDPRRFCAFIVTVTEYKYINPIPDAVRQDGIDLEEIITNQCIGQYLPENVVRLENPTKKQFQKNIKTFTKQCRKVRKKTKGRLTVFVYLAGHTGKVKGGRRKGDYLLMRECKPTTNKKLTQGAMKIKDIMKKVIKLNPKNVLYVMHSNHAKQILQGIKSIDITLDSEGTEFEHLTDQDKLTVRGVQNDIDHDILSHLVKKKRKRRTIIANQKQLDKMAGTYISDLDNDDDDDDDNTDDEFMEDSSKKRRKKRKNKPASNIMCLTSCMNGQLSRYGDPIHCIQPKNTILGLHLCAAFCGRTIHQQVLERIKLKRRTMLRKKQEDCEQREQCEKEEKENQSRQKSSNNDASTRSKHYILRPRFETKDDSNEVYINHDNQVVYTNRYAQKDADDSKIRGLRCDVLLCGVRQEIENYSKILDQRRDAQVLKDKSTILANSRLALATSRKKVEDNKNSITKQLEALVLARKSVVDSQNELKEKKKLSKELAEEAGALASKAHTAEELTEAHQADQDTQACMAEIQTLNEIIEANKQNLSDIRDNISDLGNSLKNSELESRDLEKSQNELIKKMAIDDLREERRKKSRTANEASWLQTLFIRSNGGKNNFVISRFPLPPIAPPRPQIFDEEKLPKSLSLSWDMSLWNGAVIDDYTTECRGRSRADKEWRVVRNCPFLPADRHYSFFLNNRIERNIITAAAGLSPATAVQFRIRCHTAGGWSPYSKPSEFAFTSRTDWWGKAVTPRIPRRLEDLLIEEGRKKGGIVNILNIMKRNIDKIALLKRGLALLSGHITIGTSSSFSVQTNHSNKNKMKQRAKISSKGVKPNRALEHAKNIIAHGAIETVCEAMKLHQHCHSIQLQGMRLCGWWVLVQDKDEIRRRIINCGGLECAERNLDSVTLGTIALWSVELLKSKLTNEGAAILVQNLYRKLIAKQKVIQMKEEKRKIQEKNEAGKMDVVVDVVDVVD